MSLTNSFFYSGTPISQTGNSYPWSNGEVWNSDGLWSNSGLQPPGGSSPWADNSNNSSYCTSPYASSNPSSPAHQNYSTFSPQISGHAQCIDPALTESGIGNMVGNIMFDDPSVIGNGPHYSAGFSSIAMPMDSLHHLDFPWDGDSLATANFRNHPRTEPEVSNSVASFLAAPSSQPVHTPVLSPKGLPDQAPRSPGFICHKPECNQRMFKRKADLQRHIHHIHLSKDQKKNFFCDYPRCNRAKAESPFHRRDHLRDHYRDYHKDEVVKQGFLPAAAQRRKTAAVSSSCPSPPDLPDLVDVRRDWWRCAKCLGRLKNKLANCQKCNEAKPKGKRSSVAGKAISKK